MPKIRPSRANVGTAEMGPPWWGVRNEEIKRAEAGDFKCRQHAAIPTLPKFSTGSHQWAITGSFFEFVPSNYYLMCFGNVLGTWSTTVFLIVILLTFFFF